jgi:phosphoribosylformimino-5-aminoimidazole carboxamide ribotide isomerase
VRLRGGSFDEVTRYAESPAQAAARFADAGVPWLHVVDLDGARAGRPAQVAAIAEIARTVAGRTRVEAAGGIRTPADARGLLDLPIDRVVLGTAAVEHPDVVAELVAEFGSARIAVAVDVRDGSAVGRAWRGDAPRARALDIVARMGDLGVESLEVTAIDRDGSLAGPDLELLAAVASETNAQVIASGGIRSIEDLLAVRDAGCAGAIVGRSIHEGRLDLAAALERLSDRG